MGGVKALPAAASALRTEYNESGVFGLLRFSGPKAQPFIQRRARPWIRRRLPNSCIRAKGPTVRLRANCRAFGPNKRFLGVSVTPGLRPSLDEGLGLRPECHSSNTRAIWIPVEFDRDALMTGPTKLSTIREQLRGAIAATADDPLQWLEQRFSAPKGSLPSGQSEVLESLVGLTRNPSFLTRSSNDTPRRHFAIDFAQAKKLRLQGPMKILFLHGWQSTPGGMKPTYLKDHGHEVLNPALPDDDFDAAVRIAQAEFDQHRPDVVVGSSRGGAVAMNIDAGSTPLVLICPAWKKWGTARTVKPGTIILHSKADDVVPFAGFCGTGAEQRIAPNR